MRTGVDLGLERGQTQQRQGQPFAPTDEWMLVHACLPAADEIVRFLPCAQAIDGAGEGNRTLVSSLGSYSSAIELHPLARPDTLRCPSAGGNALAQRGDPAA